MYEDEERVNPLFKKHIVLPISAFLCLGLMPSNLCAQETASNIIDKKAKVSTRNHISGPDAVENLLRDSSEAKQAVLDKNFFEALDDWKKKLYDQTGLKIGGDYNALYFGATDSLGNDESSSGVLRLYGSWELTGRGTADTGSLVYKIEQRHSYGDVAPTDFGFEVGYVGLLQSVFSDQGFRTTNLYWRQSFLNSRLVTYLGFMDVTDYVDVYALASPWTSFSNLVFATGSATIGGLPDGSLGAMVAYWATDNIYIIGGVADANADPTEVFSGFDTFFSDFETFKSVGVVWTTGKEKIFMDNIQLTLWQIDEKKDAGTPDGWGVSFSATTTVDDKLMPFIRGGWSEDGGSILEASISTGIGYLREPGGDMFGVGLNWGRPNHNTFGANLDDQYTSEAFYRWQVAQHLQVTPSIQLLINPAMNPNEDLVTVFGLRARMTF